MSIAKAINAAAKAEYQALLEFADNVDTTDDLGQLSSLAAALKSFGFITEAKRAHLRMLALDPSAEWVLGNLASVEQDLGNFAEALSHYRRLTDIIPDHPVVSRNALLCMEYLPESTDEQRLMAARSWGGRLISRIGARPRPRAHPLSKRKLRVGYVSADFCQHTAGLFVLGVIEKHTDEVELFAYSSTPKEDWVTQRLRKVTHFKDIRSLTDEQLAALIVRDQIDVLVDLSGHTAGSRLTAFAYRPAPVMLSWLGYFATTGLEYVDAVIFDEWHVPADSEEQFVEQVVRLESGRLTYTPVPWMPAEVPDYPMRRKGYVTFGSFNNTNKMNTQVFDVWAAILRNVPHSKLLLKWRTLNDTHYRSKILREFTRRGINSAQIELRAPSFHKQMLTEYADVDISLDPFPFTGGVTSLEALYLGRPVITWPQSRAVSRQTFAFLSAVGCADLAVSSADAYIKTAVHWASDAAKLERFGKGIRCKMRTSVLMQPGKQAGELESVYRMIFNAVYKAQR